MNLPKLKVRGLGWNTSKEYYNFEQAKFFPYSEDVVIVVEGQAITSYEELFQLVTREHYEGKEFLEVTFLPIIVGG